MCFGGQMCFGGVRKIRSTGNLCEFRQESCAGELSGMISSRPTVGVYLGLLCLRSLYCIIAYRLHACFLISSYICLKLILERKMPIEHEFGTRILKWEMSGG